MEARARRLLKYVTESGRCPFDEWVECLKDKRTQAIVATRLNRVVQGNLGLCRKLEGGIQGLFCRRWRDGCGAPLRWRQVDAIEGYRDGSKVLDRLPERVNRYA